MKIVPVNIKLNTYILSNLSIILIFTKHCVRAFTTIKYFQLSGADIMNKNLFAAIIGLSLINIPVAAQAVPSGGTGSTPAAAPAPQPLRTDVGSLIAACSTLKNDCIAAGYVKDGPVGGNLISDCINPLIADVPKIPVNLTVTPDVANLIMQCRMYKNRSHPVDVPASANPAAPAPAATVTAKPAAAPASTEPAAPAAPVVAPDPGD
jgi:hypothetical protein